ncbi:high affinity immunoglobulin gamma Fc receptor I-like isoform X2 [Engraulis encrasicolus]|uniref:high affinity immunoglobulin gamma Fc receptor I-like isoform X2 n=1 Tax=Engraulis encrasicolus TaxID=184585 RepID=UPI002FD44C3A
MMKILLLLSVKMVAKYGLVYAGDTVLLKCSNVPSKWFFNGKRMPSNTEQVLILPAVSRDDNGYYQCATSTGISDQFNITVLDKEVLLEVPPEPVVLGEPLTLRCVVQGGAAIRKAVFYKNGNVVRSTNDGLYSILAVTSNDNDSYSCQADYQYTFTNPNGALKTGVKSDPQTITIRARPPTAHVISNNQSLECSCPDCPSSASFNWYFRESSAARKEFYLHTKGTSMLYYFSAGEYVCRAFWEYGASGLSKPKNTAKSPPSNPLWILFIALGLLALGAVILAILCFKKRGANSTEREDMQMNSLSKRRRRAAEGDEEDAQDNAYQTLTGQEKTEYQTLPASQGGGGDGGYEAVGAAKAREGADGGYEALKVKGQSDVYHTLQQPSTSQGAQGEYEALKGNRQIDTYETMKQREAEGVGVDYEHIKEGQTGASDEDKGLYQPLGATGGDGGYEELRAKRQGL